MKIVKKFPTVFNRVIREVIMHRRGVEERGEISGGPDTRCSFTAAHQIEARCINDARLASPGQVHLKCHLKKHKRRINAMLVELE